MDANSLLQLAISFRAAQFYAHMAHNLTSGPTFFSDHSFLGDLYGTYEDAYDSLVERVIGLGEVPYVASLTDSANKEFQKSAGDSDPDQFFRKLIVIEAGIRKGVSSAIQGQSQGTINFLQGLADESEQRTYKLKQRVK